MSELSEAERTAAIIELTKQAKADLHDLLIKYGVRTAELAVKSIDPHTPVISTLQLAFAQAVAEYLVVCGLSNDQAANTTLKVTGQAMEHWARALVKHSEAHAAKNKPTVLHMPPHLQGKPQ